MIDVSHMTAVSDLSYFYAKYPKYYLWLVASTVNTQTYSTYRTTKHQQNKLVLKWTTSIIQWINKINGNSFLYIWKICCTTVVNYPVSTYNENIQKYLRMVKTLQVLTFSRIRRNLTRAKTLKKLINDFTHKWMPTFFFFVSKPNRSEPSGREQNNFGTSFNENFFWRRQQMQISGVESIKGYISHIYVRQG